MQSHRPFYLFPVKQAVGVAAKRTILTACAFFIAIWAFLGALFAPIPASAAGRSSVERFESGDVLQDLKGAQIAGKEFTTADYPQDNNGRPQILSLSEFGYSASGDQTDYGLYLYVYNPTGMEIEDTVRNKVQLSVAGGGYGKYQVTILDASDDLLFYKLRVDLADRREDVLDAVDPASRQYTTSGIELTVGGILEDYPAATDWIVTGYAEGYGADPEAGSTLNTEAIDFERYLTLDVRSTYYRPDGPNGKDYERDTLHSVYFSVPDEIIAQYGEMTAVHATWRNAQTAPVLVTGNQDVYNAILPYIGQAVDGGDFTYAKDDNSPVPYAIIASKYIESAGFNNAAYGSSYMSYNANRKYTASDVTIDALQYVFLADGSADDYTLSAELLVGNNQTGEKGYFELYTAEHGGELVQDKYSAALFSEVADQMTDVTIRATDTFSLTEEIISQNLWQQFIGGGYEVTGQKTYTVSAIRKVEQKDLVGDPNTISNDLYFDETDIPEFVQYCAQAETNRETVYLFRYMQSGYLAYECAEYLRGEGDWTIFGTQFGYDFVDTDAYLMQMWVQLDFDIIDLTFTAHNIDTIIPVVATPQDMAADGDHPIITTDDIDWGLVWWLAGVGGVMVLGAIFGAKLERFLS